MGIPILEELSERLHRSIAAGSLLLKEDFRLVRTIEQFEKVSQANPVFQKIYKQGKLLLEETEKKEEKLLDLISLIDAVLITQTKTMLEGEAEILHESSTASRLTDLKDGQEVLPVFAQYKYSELKPVYDALTTNGSGRFEVINSAFKNRTDLIYERRIRTALINGLGDQYTQISDLVKEILCKAGKQIIPDLKYNFSMDDIREMALRLEIIEELAGSEENDFYKEVVTKSSGTLKQKAIFALRYDRSNLPQLFAMADTEQKNIKKTVFGTIARMQGEEVDTFFADYLEKEDSIAEDYLILNDSILISDILAEKVEWLCDLIEEFKGKKVKDKYMNSSQIKKAQTICRSMLNKTSLKMLNAIRRLCSMITEFSSIKDKKGNPLEMIYVYNGVPGKSNLSEQMALLLEKTVVLTENDAYGELMLELAKEYSFCIPAAFYYTLLKNPDNAYSLIAPYISEDKTVKRNIINCLYNISYERESYYLGFNFQIESGLLDKKDIRKKRKLHMKLDSELIEFLVQNEEIFITSKLISGTKSKENEIYCSFLYQKALEGKRTNYLYELLRCHNKQWRGILSAYMKNLITSHEYDLIGVIEAAKRFDMPKEELLMEFKQVLKELEEGNSLLNTKNINKQSFIAKFTEEVNTLQMS